LPVEKSVTIEAFEISVSPLNWAICPVTVTLSPRL